MSAENRPTANSQQPKALIRSAVFALILVCAACANLSGEPRIVQTIQPVPPTDVPPRDRGVPAAAPDLAAGARLYAENCAACHGESGRGDGPVALGTEGMQPGDFTDPARARGQTPHEWFRTVTHGNIENLMPPWGNVLTEQERWDVALYTYTMHYDPDALWVGQRIFQDCAECHGPEGRGDGPEARTIPQDVGDLSDFESMVTLSDESMFKMVTEGFEEVMPSYAELPEDDRWAVVSYARTLSLLHVPQLEATTTASPAASGTTNASTAITGTALLLQIHAAGDALDVVQALRVRNTTETLAFSSGVALPDGQVAALALTLPDGAILTSTSGVAGVSDDGSIAYVLDPLPPMSEQLYVLGYTLPYAPGDPVTVPLDIVVAGPVRVLVRPLEMRLRSTLLPSLGEETLGGELYNTYGDQLALQAGTALTFSLEGTPDVAAILSTAPAPTSIPAGPQSQPIVPSTVLGPLVLAAAALVAVLVGAFAWRTRTISPEARIMQLAREIGKLDAAHKAGTLNHDLWHRQRAVLKAEQMRLRGFPDETETDE